MGPGLRPFLQPLAVAAVALVLVCLALFSGMMDLRALDKTLTGYMERRGVDIVESIRQGAGYYFHLLHHRPSPRLDDFALPDYDQPSFPLRESMIIHLMDLVRDMDLELADGRLTHAQLKDMAFQQGMWFLGFFNEQEGLAFANRPPPGPILQKAGSVIRGEERILIHMFGRPENKTITGWMALRRRAEKGSILVALNPEGERFWKLRTAVQRAIGEVGLGGEVGYIVVTDQEQRRLGSMGQAPDSGEGSSPEQNGAMDLEKGETRKVLLDGRKLLQIKVPVQFDRGLSGVVQVALSRERADAMLVKEKKRGIVMMSFVGFIALLSMWLLYQNQNRHLRKMRAVGERLHQAERLSALGRMAAGVAHEIRNPLNAISMACQRLNRENIHQLSGVIRDEIRRLDQIVEEFLSVSKHRNLTFRPHDIKALLGHIVFLMDEENTSRGVQMVREWSDGPLLIPMDVDRMTQALLNIIKNAVEAILQEGTVTLSVKEVEKAWARIEISDTGRGLTPEERRQMFDPDYTTKEKGLGLGLPLAHEIIQGHGGKLRVRSEPDAGTTVEILLPLKR